MQDLGQQSLRAGQASLTRLLRASASEARRFFRLYALPPAPERGSLALELLDPRLERRPRTLITFFGCSRRDIEARLDGVLKAAEMHGEVPVFVITDPCFDEFRARGAYVEFFPAPFERGVARNGRYAHYLKSRYAHLIAKWQVTSEVEMGVSLDSFLESASPTGAHRSAPSAPDKTL